VRAGYSNTLYITAEFLYATKHRYKMITP